MKKNKKNNNSLESYVIQLIENEIDREIDIIKTIYKNTPKKQCKKLRGKEKVLKQEVNYPTL